MIISLSDPDDSSVVGELFNTDIIVDALLQGGQLNLFSLALAYTTTLNCSI
jgi:hypothetical protein